MLLPIALLLAHAALPAKQLQIIEEDTFESLQMGNPDAILSMQIKAVLPDGSHVLLACQNFHDNWCKPVEMPKATVPQERHCSDSSPDRDLSTLSHSCTYKNLGMFPFEKKADSITIFNRNGRSVLRIQGHW